MTSPVHMQLLSTQMQSQQIKVTEVHSKSSPILSLFSICFNHVARETVTLTSQPCAPGSVTDFEGENLEKLLLSKSR